MGELLKRTFIASVWSSFAEIIAKVITPLVFLVLTRILSPDDFGIVAIATTVLGFASIIIDVGTAKVLIQTQFEGDDFRNLCNNAFGINLIFGISLFLICFFSSNYLAILNDNPLASPVIKVMSFQIVFNSLCIVQTSCFRRKLKFRSLFYIRLITVVTPALVSVPIAFLGYGYWSIVYGSVVGSILSCIVLWRISDWKPKIAFNIKCVKMLLSKSVWTTLEQVFNYLPLFFDTYLIVNYLSTKDLGFYSSSRTLFSAAVSLCLAPVLPVLFSSFSKIINDDVKFRKVVLVAQKYVFLIAATMGITVFGFRIYVEDLLFGIQWKGISRCFGIVFLIFGVESFYSAVIESIRAKGDFKGISINTIIAILITLGVQFLAVRHGLTIYVLARSLALFVFYPGIFYLSKADCGISFKDCLHNVRIELIILLIYFIAICVINNLSFGYYINLILLVLSFMSMLLLLYLSNRNEIIQILYRIK